MALNTVCPCNLVNKQRLNLTLVGDEFFNSILMAHIPHATLIPVRYEVVADSTMYEIHFLLSVEVSAEDFFR